MWASAAIWLKVRACHASSCHLDHAEMALHRHFANPPLGSLKVSSARFVGEGGERFGLHTSTPASLGPGSYKTKDTWAAEYVGGKQRWRYYKVEAEAQAPPKSKRRLAKSQSDTAVGDYKHLGYNPGQPRRPPPESLLSSMVPAQWRAYGSPMPDIRPQEAMGSQVSAPRCQGLQSSPVEITTLKDVRVLKLNPEGDRLLVKRWARGHAESLSRS